MLTTEFHRVLGELVRRQDRVWFREHREEIREHCERPMLALFEEVAVLAEARGVDLPFGEPELFRLARDTRFSADKAPYKEQIAGYLPLLGVGERGRIEQVMALYLHVGVRDGLAASGIYAFAPDILLRYRERVLEDSTGQQLEAIVRELEQAGYALDGIAKLKRAPRGVDPAHPRADLLRWKGLCVGFPAWEPRAELGSDFAGRLALHVERCADLLRWLMACAEEVSG